MFICEKCKLTVSSRQSGICQQCQIGNQNPSVWAFETIKSRILQRVEKKQNQQFSLRRKCVIAI